MGRHLSEGPLPLCCLISVLVVLALGGCATNECTAPTCLTEIDLESMWPNADGTFWLYTLTTRIWESAGMIEYATPQEVPEAPSLDEIAIRLYRNEVPNRFEIEEGTYRLEFDGFITTLSGVTAQNLVETIDMNGREFRESEAQTDPFLSRLLDARPDIAANSGKMIGLECSSGTLHAPVCKALSRAIVSQQKVELRPLLIHGYAWEKTDAWIGTYGDLDTLLAWKFLDAVVRLPHEFSFQLVPALASDVWLHCRLLQWRTIETGVGKFSPALECIYLVDYGVARIEHKDGPPTWARIYDYGKVIYVPTVGPVFCYQRMGVNAGVDDDGFGDLTLNLIESNTIK